VRHAIRYHPVFYRDHMTPLGGHRDRRFAAATESASFEEDEMRLAGLLRFERNRGRRNGVRFIRSG
jgi:hypothetical protein